MYKGYKINTFDGMDLGAPTMEEKGSIERLQKSVYSGISEYILSDGNIDGSSIAHDWFPQIEADIFISHSHADEELAHKFAAWLKRTFGLTAFVDSGVWGQSDEMLRQVDDKFCPSQNQPGNYDYHARNKSTTYVHMLLATALAKLVDKTECLFFLGTANAVNTQSAIVGNQTHSAWLYYEIALSSLLRKPLAYHRKPDLIKGTRTFSLNEAEVRNFFTFNMETNHLKHLSVKDLREWEAAGSQQLYQKKLPLDMLYDLK